VTFPREEPTLFDIDERAVVAIYYRPGLVVMQWHGPRRCEMSPDTARVLGYLLRSYARLAADAADDQE
jgi:hypothetical protein